MSNEIALKRDEAMEAATRADFTYKITPNTVTITVSRLSKYTADYVGLLIAELEPKRCKAAG
jgi:hypothetical protein